MYLDTPTQGWVTAVCVLFCIIYFLFYFLFQSFCCNIFVIIFPWQVKHPLHILLSKSVCYCCYFYACAEKKKITHNAKKRNDSECCLARIVCLWMKHGLVGFHYNRLCCMLLMVCHFRKTFILWLILRGYCTSGHYFWRFSAFSQKIKQPRTKYLMDLVRNVPRNSKITILLQCRPLL